ncbi:MAG: hypothetical protein ACMUIA_11855 [bacterium]
MPKRKEKDFYCPVVSETVKVALKTKPSLSRTFKDELYVQCNQFECQYAGENAPPCPLSLDLFKQEIEEREERRKAKRKGYSH